MPDEEVRLQNLALVLSAVCVRNTIIEDYHASGKITDSEMEAFNRQVADRVFTFLGFMFGAEKDYEDFMTMASAQHPHKWDRPKLDQGMVNALAKFRARTREIGSPK